MVETNAFGISVLFCFVEEMGYCLVNILLVGFKNGQIPEIRWKSVQGNQTSVEFRHRLGTTAQCYMDMIAYLP